MAQSVPSLLDIVSSTLESDAMGASDENTTDAANAGQRTQPPPTSRQMASGQIDREVSGVGPLPGALATLGPTLRPGDLVAGKYRVERILSQSGLVCSVQVQHLVLDTQATLKYLTAESAAFPEIIAGFLRGARLLSQLHTGHVASVLDVGMLEKVGTPYLVMDHPEGPDFSQIIRVRGALPVDEAKLYVKQVCEGLAQAHALGIVHGSLRPGNIILTKRRDGFPIACITDFGNSHEFDFTEMTRTDSGLRTQREVLDAVRYLSPDHARHPEALDARCDVWAVGAIFFELLTGTPAFNARTPAGLLASIAADELPPLRTVRVDAPEVLEGIVRCCLAKNRDARLTNGSQLLRALEASDEDLAELSRPTRASFDTAPSPRPASVAPSETSAAKLPSTIPPTSRGRSLPPIPAPPPSQGPQRKLTPPWTPAAPRTSTHPQSPVAAETTVYVDGNDSPAAATAVTAPKPVKQPGFLGEDAPRKAKTARGSMLAVAAGLIVGGIAFLAMRGNTHDAPAPVPAQIAMVTPPLQPPEKPQPPAAPSAEAESVPPIQVAALPLADEQPTATSPAPPSPAVQAPATTTPAKVPTEASLPKRAAVPKPPVVEITDEAPAVAAPSKSGTTIATPAKPTAAPTRAPASASDDPFGTF
jgi:serine/threonine-protein kinase